MKTEDEQRLREHAISERGAYRCWRCGHQLSQDGNTMMSETGLRDPEAGEDDDAMGLGFHARTAEPHTSATTRQRASGPGTRTSRTRRADRPPGRTRAPAHAKTAKKR